MSESLRNDGRIWVPKKKEDIGKRPDQIPEEDRDYTSNANTHPLAIWLPVTSLPVPPRSSVTTALVSAPAVVASTWILPIRSSV